MNYEEKYNEILEWARKNKARLNGVPIEEVLPELRESEDERIRKKIIGCLRLKKEEGKEFFGSEPIDNCIAYLEKQKEQKSAEVDERMKNDKHFLSICQHLETLISESKNEGAEESIDKDYRWLCEFYRKSRSASVEENYKKPAEWSEEDERMRNALWNLLHLHYAQDNAQTLVGIEAGKFRSWLKSLRPSWKPSEVCYGPTGDPDPAGVWKPSEEQMEAFKKYIEEFQARAEAAVGGWNNFDVMIRLYEQLKKL